MTTPAPEEERPLTEQQEAALRAQVAASWLQQNAIPPPEYVESLRAKVTQPFLARVTAKAEDMIAGSFQDSVRAYLYTLQPDIDKKNKLQNEISAQIAESMESIETELSKQFRDPFKETIEAEMTKYIAAEVQKRECPGPCFQCNFNNDSHVCTINIPENHKLIIPKLRVGLAGENENAYTSPEITAPGQETMVYARNLNVTGQSLCKNLDVLSLEQMNQGGTSALCCQKQQDKKENGTIYFTS